MAVSICSPTASSTQTLVKLRNPQKISWEIVFAATTMIPCYEQVPYRFAVHFEKTPTIDEVEFRSFDSPFQVGPPFRFNTHDQTQFIISAACKNTVRPRSTNSEWYSDPELSEKNGNFFPRIESTTLVPLRSRSKKKKYKILDEEFRSFTIINNERLPNEWSKISSKQ